MNTSETLKIALNGIEQQVCDYVIYIYIAKQSILRNSYYGKNWGLYPTMPLPNGTVGNYQSQLRAYFRFCLFFGYTPVPCRAIHLLRYIIVFLAGTLYQQHSQLSQRCSCFAPAVYMATLTHLKTPLFRHQKTLLMRGINTGRNNVFPYFVNPSETRPQAKKDQKAVVGTKQTKKHQRNTGRMLFVRA